jgi:hypothetical protein
MFGGIPKWERSFWNSPLKNNRNMKNKQEYTMKKHSLLFTMLATLGLLVACSSNTDATANINQAETSLQDSAPDSDISQEGPPPEGFELEVPLQTALIIGSFELEETENEITTEQASELLPLWMVLKNLLESDTAAAAEIDALTNQIADTMTDAQMEQITDLEFDPQSQRTLMNELGLTEEFQRPERTDGEEGTGRGANRPEGMPEGMGPGGGQGGEGLTPEQIEELQATREAGGGRLGGQMGMMGNTVLIDALIELLQSK